MRRVYHADAGSLNAFTMGRDSLGDSLGGSLEVVAGGAEALAGVDTELGVDHR